MANTADFDRGRSQWDVPPWFFRPGWHPAWIAAIVLSFVFWWPLGLAFLIYTIWSRKMGCWNHSGRWQEKMERMRSRWETQGFAYAPSSGNRAFDEYRTETLRRLEDEQREFKDFLERLRQAKDKSEFDQFMSERRGRFGSGDQPAA